MACDKKARLYGVNHKSLAKVFHQDRVLVIQSAGAQSTRSMARFVINLNAAAPLKILQVKNFLGKIDSKLAADFSIVPSLKTNDITESYAKKLILINHGSEEENLKKM